MTNFLTIEGLRIAYTSEGSASNPPLILVHGLMSHRGVWTRTIEALKEHFFCIACDLPGFGDSDKPENGDYTIAKQAQRMLEVVNHFSFEKFNVIGHSMGGQIATYLTAKLAPQRIRKLVSVDGVVTGKLSDRAQNLNRLLVVIGEKIPALYDLSFALCKWKPYVHWAFQVWFNKPKEISFDAWELDRRMAMNPKSAHAAFEAWNSLNATNLTSMLKDIPTPTLVIFGEEDGTVPVSQARLFKEQLPAAQLALIKDCGHFPMYESFDTYIASLQEFLMKS